MAAHRPSLLPLAEAAPCCPPLGSAPLSQEQAEDAARRLKALADPARLRLLSLIMSAPNGEACTCDLTAPLGLSQPTVSHHLKKLAETGLITGERRGSWTYYSADREALAAASQCLTPTALRPEPTTPALR